MAWMNASQLLRKIPVLLSGRFSFDFDRIPFAKMPLTWARRVNLARTGVDMLLKSDRIRALPAILQIEPTNLCNLKCPLCPAGLGTMNRPRGFMTMEVFRRILDELGDTMMLAVLYGWGEPFLNKDLPAMIRACTDRGIRTFTSTNGQVLQTPDKALAVVDSGLSALVFAVDGSDEEMYQAYRKSGSLEKAKRCVSLIEEAKANRGSRLPYTNLRVVVTKDNQDALPELEQLACSLGVNMFSYKTLGCLVNDQQYSGYEPDDGSLRRFKEPGHPPMCPYVFRQPTVFWDGSVVGCEFDYELERPWGRVSEQSFREIWNGEAARATRRAFRRNKERSRFCGLCPYKNRAGGGSVITAKELRPVSIT
jgi:radical SAM protein with 4Fe4S-binding SPASM domain